MNGVPSSLEHPIQHVAACIHPSSFAASHLHGSQTRPPRWRGLDSVSGPPGWGNVAIRGGFLQNTTEFRVNEKFENGFDHLIHDRVEKRPRSQGRRVTPVP